MVECHHKFSYTYGTYADTLLREVDELVVLMLHSMAELGALRKRAERHDYPYLSLNLTDDILRPTLAHKDIAQRMGELLPAPQAILKVHSLGVNASVRQINRPKRLEATSLWRYCADLVEPDLAYIKEAIEELGMKDGVMAGQALNWSPEELGNHLVRVVQGSGISPYTY
jgi:hypothetical protein